MITPGRALLLIAVGAAVALAGVAGGALLALRLQPELAAFARRHLAQPPLELPPAQPPAGAAAAAPALPLAGGAVQYVAAGLARHGGAAGERYGFNEIRIFNPLPARTRIGVRLYFDDRPPVDLPQRHLEGSNNAYLLVLPDELPEVFDHETVWAARIASDGPVVANLLRTGGIWHPDNRFRGGMANFPGSRLAPLWYFSDGLRLEWGPEVEPAYDGLPVRFDEMEEYSILNPNPVPVDVAMHCYYLDGTRVTHVLRVEAERVRLADNVRDAPVRVNASHGIKFTSRLPVLVQGARFIEGLRSVDEWGRHLHIGLLGVPAPLEVDETLPGPAAAP